MGFGKKIRELKRALIFVVKTEIHEKNLSKRKATGYQWLLVLAQHVTNTHWYPVAFHFDDFFSWNFQNPKKPTEI